MVDDYDDIGCIEMNDETMGRFEDHMLVDESGKINFADNGPTTPAEYVYMRDSADKLREKMAAMGWDLDEGFEEDLLYVLYDSGWDCMP